MNRIIFLRGYTKEKKMLKKYVFYLIRWQLSTPILAICYAWLIAYGTLSATIIGNFVGGLLFFWVDRWIFRAKKTTE